MVIVETVLHGEKVELRSPQYAVSIVVGGWRLLGRGDS